MRRHCYIKYVVTLLMSTALTFRFLQSRSTSPAKKENYLKKESDEPGIEEFVAIGHGFEESNNYLLRRLPQGVPIPVQSNSISSNWVVLPGNITVHVGEVLNSDDTSFTINSENLCNTFDDSRLKLLVFVASSVDNFYERQAIRDTWGLKALQDALNFRIVFILGQTAVQTQKLVVEESVRYGDVIQTNIEESFRNLGRKSVSGLQWSSAYCKTADYIMKTDDDILVHVSNLIDALKAAKDPETLLLCHENRMRRILRKELLDKVPEHYRKYEVPENQLPGTFYPPYCSGMTYAFSREVRDRLLQACLVTPVFFIEDVYLTGFCRYKAGVIITAHPGITLRPPVDAHQAVCAFKDGRVTSQEVGVGELRHLWAEMNTQGFFCPRLLGYAFKRFSKFPKRAKMMKTETLVSTPRKR